MENTTQSNTDIGLPFSERRGEWYLELDGPSVPSYQRGSSLQGTTAPGIPMQRDSAGGSDVIEAGLPAAQAELGTEDGLMADTTSAREGGRQSLPREGGARPPSQSGAPSRSGDPPPNGGQERPKRSRPRRPLVQIATLNIRGCGAATRQDRNKLQQAVRWMRSSQVSIMALQETYDCTTNFTDAERFNAKVWAFPNPGSTHAAGTGFIVHSERLPPGMGKADFKHEILMEGRLDLLTWTWGETPVTIANLYAPNAPQAAIPFFEQVIGLLRRRRIDVVLGDWNCVESAEDRFPRKQPTQAIKDVMRDLRVKLDVKDSWREDNPHAKEYTWENSHANADGTTSRSRIDRILLSPDLAERTIEHSVDVSLTLSDHYPVRVKVIDDKAPDMGESRWRMNLEDLEDEWAMDRCGEILLKCQANMGREPMTKWLNAKRDIQKVLRDRQTMRRKERGKHLSELKQRRLALTKRRDYHTNSGIRHEEGLLRERIANIERGKLERASESSAARFAEKGESVNKYWFSIGKSIKESSVIRSLSTGDDDETFATEEMLSIAQDHHQRLQACPELTPEREEAIQRMVETTSGKRFTDSAREDLDSRITPPEVRTAIKQSQNGKAPGKDGIPYEFYKFWVDKLDTTTVDRAKVPDIAWILSVVWNDIADGSEPPAEYVEGLMFLLYKKKRRDRIENYRPITLLGCDYKLQTKLLATRLGRNVHHALHPDQAGFVPGRDILDHVKLAKHVKELCDVTERNGCLVALDQEKAYDRIDHTYLWEILRAFRVPDRFVRTVQLLYASAATKVLVNQAESAPFHVERGVRQGDPLSCLLFDLAIEPLAESLRRSTLKGINIPNVVERLVVRLFADDTQLYLSQKDKWSDVKRITDDWCLASTAKFNESKTEFLPMGQPDYRKQVSRWKCLQPNRIRTTELLPREARYIQDTQPLRILGGIVGNKVDEAQIWEPVVSKVEALADKWSKKRMTLKGRRLITTFLMQSKAQYLSMTNDPPNEAVARIMKATHKVMWAGKKRGLTTMTEVERPITEGGFGVPNFKLRVRTARLMTAKKWCSPLDERPLWADVVDDLIRLSSKKPDDPRKVSVLWQTWKETSGKTSSLPRDVQAMLKELRRYDLRAEALKLSQNARDEAPVWLSKTTDLSLREENSAAMRHLRKFHRVQTLADLKKVRIVDNQGCKKHTHCVEAVNLIHGKTAPRMNVRFVTPFLDGENTPDGLDFTERRKDKAKRDVVSGRPVTLDPSFTHTATLREALRVFGTPPSAHAIPAYRQGCAPDRSTNHVVYTDGSATDSGTPQQRVGFGVVSETEALNVKSRLLRPPVTNNRAELAAVVWALNEAPTNQPITIHTDSQYVVTGLTGTAKVYEDLGWLNVVNADLWKRALFMVRSRTAETTIAKVKAHAGIQGNEDTDAAAKAGAEGLEDHFPETQVPERWTLNGARLATLDFATTYEWVRHRDAGECNTRARANLDRIQETLRDTFGLIADDAMIWLSLRRPYIRREISDFLWAMLHGRSPCGSMFSKWGPGWEELQYCKCGAVETMEHLLTGCDDALWRRMLWREAAKLMKRSRLIDDALCRPPTFVEIMAAGAVRLPKGAATRLWATLVSETAFVVWKLRNRSRFDEIEIPKRMAKEVWRDALKRRAKTDLAASKLKGTVTAPEDKRRKEAVAAWGSLLTIKGGVTVWNPADYG